MGWIVWNVDTCELLAVPSLELVVVEFEFEARPLSKLVVELRHPPLLATPPCTAIPAPLLETDDDSTVPILALLSSPGLSRPGL